MKETIKRIMIALGVMLTMSGLMVSDYHLFTIMAARHPGNWYWEWGRMNFTDPLCIGVSAFLSFALAILVASVEYDAFKMLKEMRKER